MTQLDTLKSKLETARDEHEALKTDLPRFHSLLTDNEQTAERLRREKADLDEQAQARGRVNVAREMLEQHQSDIATAQGEVTRLEREIGQEYTLLRMVDHSKEAKTERSRIDKAFLHLASELQRATSTIGEAWTAENEARRSFAEEGLKLMPQHPNFMDLGAAHNLSDQARQRVGELEKDLETRGAELEAIKDGATGSFTFLDRYAVKELPNDTVSVLLWEAIRLLTEHDPNAHNLRRFTPKRAHPTAQFTTFLEAGGVAHG